MRYSCGGNDHPDPKMFAQVYRLATSFSLIRPPRGCNVSGTNLLRSLVEAKEVLTISNKASRDSWIRSIDDMLESNEPILANSSADADHDYNEAVTSDAVQSYIAGYIVRKLKKILKCSNCLQCIQMSGEAGKQLQRNDVICKMDLYGGLLFASDELFSLTKQLERCVLRAISRNLTNLDTISEIAVELKKEVIMKVGCFEHQNKLTLKIIDIYVVMRAHFLAKSENKRYDEAKIRTKRKKNAKLLS
ncbi:hypothetical protein PV327_010122 [Microctonus hyperodae]|uniref:Uncharacterized protein n=1 Tax=Microctonus hyperodae TaxID=165561 RepID=A0AA39KUL2_MICHY|nr:hypothetical protein PV327_010122 [Microctonus hyperodae]